MLVHIMCLIITEYFGTVGDNILRVGGGGCTQIHHVPLAWGDIGSTPVKRMVRDREVSRCTRTESPSVRMSPCM